MPSLSNLPIAEILISLLLLLCGGIVGALWWEVRTLRQKVHDAYSKISAAKGRNGLMELRLKRIQTKLKIREDRRKNK